MGPAYLQCFIELKRERDSHMRKTKLSKAGKPSYYILLAVVIIIGAVLALSFTIYNRKPQSQNTTQTTTEMAVSNLTEVMPGPFPNTNCPARFYNESSTVVNTAGFSVYNLSSVKDYLIAPGNNGSILYNVKIGTDLNNPTQKAEANITNWAEFYHIVQEHQNNTINTTFNNHPGINVSFKPLSEMFYFNSSYNVMATINVATNASLGTYWVVFSPGVCFGGQSILITVGTAPYSGKVTSQVYN